MPHKDVGEWKLLTKTMPMLGAAGLSLAIGTSAAIGSTNPDVARVPEPTMDEEQISDISLATFHLFDGDRGGPPRRRPATISQGACGTGLYYPQSPPATGPSVYEAPPPARPRPTRPTNRYRRPYRYTDRSNN
jgi:hypothetical protein